MVAKKKQHQGCFLVHDGGWNMDDNFPHQPYPCFYVLKGLPVEGIIEPPEILPNSCSFLRCSAQP
jgi:hypothetical protein